VPELEETVTSVLDALATFDGVCAQTDGIKTRVAKFAPPTSWDEVYGVDLSCHERPDFIQRLPRLHD
jgi:hypothetical protein